MALLGSALLHSTMIVPGEGASNPAAGAVPLEVIVKFSRDSDPGRVVRQVLAEAPTDLRPLAPVEERLHAATGIAMESRGITSGAEVILGIPEEPLLERARETVAPQPGVSGARLMASDHRNPNLPHSLLVVEFAASSDHKALVERARDDPGYAAELQALATRLCGPSGVPVRGQAGPGGEMIVSLDRAALLADLVARLNGLDFVEYAQANAMLMPMK